MSDARLNPETARLSDCGLLPSSPSACKLCGASSNLARWQEHDHNDQPERRLVVLCKRCSDRAIESHPRLYRQLHPNAPWPGAMALCADCLWRKGVHCSNPRAKDNGGPGVMLSVGKPVHAFVDGVRNGRRTGWQETWYEQPPYACRERSVP